MAVSAGGARRLDAAIGHVGEREQIRVIHGSSAGQLRTGRLEQALYLTLRRAVKRLDVWEGARPVGG